MAHRELASRIHTRFRGIADRELARKTLARCEAGRDDKRVVRSRPLQIPNHEARDLVHKPSCLFTGEDFRAMQDSRVRQRLHSCHADEGSDIQFSNAQLISMCLEIASNIHVCVIYRVEVYQPSGTGDLLCKDTMKLGIDAVSVNPG